jgi:ribosomal subunit interface protein
LRLIVEIVIHGRHTDIDDNFKDHVLKQSTRLEKFGVKIALFDVEVTHRENKRRKKVEFQVDLTAKGAGTNLRSQAEGSDMNACFDHALKRLEEQLRRTADRRRFHRHREDSVLSAADVSKLKGI